MVVKIQSQSNAFDSLPPYRGRYRIFVRVKFGRFISTHSLHAEGDGENKQQQSFNAASATLS